LTCPDSWFRPEKASVFGMLCFSGFAVVRVQQGLLPQKSRPAMDGKTSIFRLGFKMNHYQRDKK